MFHNEPWARPIQEILGFFTPSWGQFHPWDYVLHFGVSFVLVQFIFSVLFLQFPKAGSLIAAICCAFALGILKELIDVEISVEDLFFDIAGIATAVLLIAKNV